MVQIRKPHHKNDSGRDWGLLLVICSIFLFVGGLFYEGTDVQRKNKIESTQVDLSSKGQSHVVNDKIDQNLKDSQWRKEIYERQVDIDSAVTEEFDSSSQTRVDSQSNALPLLFDQENPGAKVLKDTDASRRSREKRPLTPEQRVTAKLERDRWLAEEDETRRIEYIRQFLQNARKKGLDIKLNKDLEIMSVESVPVEEPLRLPQSDVKGQR